MERERLEFAVFTRLGKSKYDELNNMLNQSRYHNMSELIRAILLNKKIVVETYDKSLDKVMAELSAIQKELQSIGININQVTRKLHQEQFPQTQVYLVQEVVKLYQQADLKLSALFPIIAQLSEKWLQE